MSEKRSIESEDDQLQKKLKLETEESTSNGVKIVQDVVKVKFKKMVMCLCYSGKDYLGMQRNPGTKTIEDDLIQAIYTCGLIHREHLDTPQTMMFQRAARTDKGVSAAKQIVSLKLPVSVSSHEMIEMINKNLCPQIRVIGIKRTTKGFNSKISCDARTYAYMLPSFAFATDDSQVNEAFRISNEHILEVNDLLSTYKGSHNYHNFTSGRKSTDPSSMRYIMSCECSLPFVRDDLEFLNIRIKGQSFMLHQIRKMVGLAIAIIRGHAQKEIIKRAWGPEKLDIPIAPAAGLMLEEVHYERYNQRYGGDGIHEAIDWSECQDVIQKFKEDYIYPTIIETEKNEKSMLTWVLENLPIHTYDVREPGPPTSSQEEKKSSQENSSPENKLESECLNTASEVSSCKITLDSQDSCVQECK